MKISRLLVIGLWGCWVIGLSGCAKTEIKNTDSRGTNIVCFGDSVTFGYGVNQEESYPAALSKILAYIPVINAGIDGDTTTEAMLRLDADVLDRDPLLVIIEFGGNDFLRKMPFEASIENVRQMVQRIQARGAMVAIMDISSGPLMGDYHRAFFQIARESKAIYIRNAFGGIITNPKLKSDFLHPNGNGYKMIAQRCYRAILPALNQNAIAKKLKK